MYTEKDLLDLEYSYDSYLEHLDWDLYNYGEWAEERYFIRYNLPLP